MNDTTELEATINDMVQKGRGVLAADESTPTIAKRFKAIDVESTEESRRAWRSLLVTTPGLGDYICGIILFEETLTQRTGEGKTVPKAAWLQAIVPGIKVDKGKIPLALSAGDLITKGLDGLAERLRSYKKELVRDVKSLVEKYRRAMDWDIPDNDEKKGDVLIFETIQKALDVINDSNK